MSYYLVRSEKRLRNPNQVIHSISIGLICGLGAVVFFLLLGIGASFAGTAFSQYLIKVKPLIALLFFILGTLLVANISIDLSSFRNRLSSRFSTSQDAGTISTGSFFVYGFGYGLATTGCTFPIFFSLFVVPIRSGQFLMGFLPFVSFALAMGLLMVVITVMVGFSKDALLKKLMTSALWIKKISGLILILAGLYMGYFFIMAGM